MKTVALALILAASTLSFAKECPTCDPIAQTALDNLNGKLGDIDNVVIFWVTWKTGPKTHSTYDDGAVDYIRQRQGEIDHLRVWARTLPDSRDRNAYLVALDGYQEGLNEARKEYRYHQNLNEMNTYEQYLERCEKAKVKLAEKHHVPLPPQ